MAAGLASDFPTATPEELDQLRSANIARQLQAGMTSSLTKCRRVRLGLPFSSKWQRTASCTFFLSSSSVSASVQMEWLRAFVSKPPSSDSCTAKIISLCDMLKPRIDYIPPSAGGNGCFDRGKRTAGTKPPPLLKTK